MQTLVLWDIDGTLVRGRGRRISVNAFVRALERVSKRTDILNYPRDASGKTDTQIALDALAAAAVSEAEAAEILEEFGHAYLAELEQDRHSLMQDLEVLPGVREVLRALAARGVTQSLLTGNLEPIARLKLTLTELDQYLDFEVGAFGSDHPDRSCLVPIARRRVLERRGFSPEAIVVVGDTPRDIACARAGDAYVVAVATGQHTRENLGALGPDVVLDDLSDTESVVEILLRYSTNRDAQLQTSPHRLEA